MRLYDSDETLRALRRLGILPRHEVTGSPKPKGSHWPVVREVVRTDGRKHRLTGIVPLAKRPIKRGTMQDILKQLDLTEEEFEAAVK